MQFSVAVRDARLDAIEVAIGADPVMRLFTGSAPANCAAADSGTLLCELTLPANWMDAASGGVKAKAGTWQDLTANADGSFGHFRIYESTGTTCGLQGTAGLAGEMVTSAATVATGDSFTVTSFSLTDGNA